MTVLANANTGLTANDVFFFGSAIGDAGVSNTSTIFKVSAVDTTITQTHVAPVGSNNPITNVFDFNRDGAVGTADITLDQTHGTTNVTGLQVINIGAGGPFAPLPPAPIDQVPVVDPNGSDPGTYTATWYGSGPVSAVDPTNTPHGATVTDADDTNLTSMTVSIASPQTHDVLNATASGTIAISGNGTNTLIFTGGSSLADYQATLRTLTYNNTQPGEATGPKTINYHGRRSAWRHRHGKLRDHAWRTSTVAERFLFYSASGYDKTGEHGPAT